MNPDNKADITVSEQIIEMARSFGTSLAGIASLTSIMDSPTYKIFKKPDWPLYARTVLVLALVHEIHKPELDWWDDKKDGSPGNRKLVEISEGLVPVLKEKFNINAYPLAYHPGGNGIFLKDSAALAGLGVIGRNNLLVTPEFGPGVRLKGMFLDTDLEPVTLTPADFSPCDGCGMPCIKACPVNAFNSGSFTRDNCQEQMDMDVANRTILEKDAGEDNPVICTKYCRACELECPIGR